MQTKDPVEYVSVLLDMRDKYEHTITKAFQDDKMFRNTLNQVRMAVLCCAVLHCSRGCVQLLLLLVLVQHRRACRFGSVYSPLHHVPQREVGQLAAGVPASQRCCGDELMVCMLLLLHAAVV